MAQPYIVHAPSAKGDLALPFAKAAVRQVAVSGVDLVLTLADGSRHLLPGVALKVMTGPLAVAFTDGRQDGAGLLGEAGRVVLSDVVARTAASAAPTRADEPVAEKRPEAAESPADEPAARPPVPAPGMTPADPAPRPGAEASYEARPATPAPPPVMLAAPPAAPTAPASAPGNNNPPPPPPPPPDKVAVALNLFNVTGQESATLPGGGVRVTGAGGVPASASDPSPSVQAAREQIAGSAGADELIGDGAGPMGTGFARVLEIRLAAREALEVRSVSVSGLPSGFALLGASRLGDAWQLELPANLAASGNTLRVVVQYPVAADDAAFNPIAFELVINATGVMEDKTINGTLVVPGIVRDVVSAADMSYSAGGLPGFVLPAFGLGDEIHAGAGHDVVRGLVGHDLVFGDAGNDTLDGGAGNDVLVGGEGADRLIGGSGRDTADYRTSADAVTVDLVTGRGRGGEAEGDVLSGIENLTGGSGDDALDGGDGFDTADYAGSSAGVRVNLASGEGAGGDAEGDVLTGIEAVRGAEFNDVLTGDAGINRLDGGGGDDLLDGGAGADQLQGGAGRDTATYAASAAAVVVSLGTGQGRGGDAEGDRLQDIENLVGSRNADELTGDDAANRLDGGAGDDWLEGGEGADELIGGTGTDTASYLGAQAGVHASLQNPASNTGDAAGDRYSGIENLEGSERNDVLVGDAGANLLFGAPGDDDVQGGAGDDLLIGGAGADQLDGGAGIDTASYAQSNEGVQVDLDAGVGVGGDADGDTLANTENLIGSRYSDRLVGDAANNVLDGGRGNDVLAGGIGADRLIGADGSDTADYSTSAESITVNLATGLVSGGDANGDTFESIENVWGGANADVLTGDASANRLDGNGGDDQLTGGSGNDRLNGGAGNDLLIGVSGADVLSGGAGTDTASYAGSAAVQVSLASGRGSRGDAEGDTLTGIENLVGGNFDDALVGDAAANRLDGGSGDDTLEGGAGADELVGGAGRDTAGYAGAAAGVAASLLAPGTNTGDAAGDSYGDIENLAGSAHADVLGGDAQDNLLDGGAGDDLLAGREGADVLRGGDGVDAASYADAAAAVNVSLATGLGQGGDAEGDVLDGIENLIGSGGADVLAGDAGANRLDGRAGDDLLDGGAGADLLVGGSGNDTAGHASATAAVVANLQQSSLNEGDAAGDSYDGIENLLGSDFDDVLTGDAQNNRLQGGAGNDLLRGGLGADALVGGAGIDTASYAGAAGGVTASLANAAANTGEAAGDSTSGIENLLGSAFNDTLVGDAGANRLDGGDGDDGLTGGAGADVLVGGNGSDTASYAASSAGVDVSLQAGRGLGGDAQGDVLSGIEHLVGSAQADVLTGNGLANRLEGGAGDDQLDGGAGADTLVGGTGDDTYTVEQASDQTIEAPGAGNDLVRASLSWTLAADIEGLTLTGSADTDATGNALDNALTGNAGNNRLDGREGADALAGGGGDDTYTVDNVGDTVAEEADAGEDSVFASVSFTLSAHVDNLTLTGGAHLNATGNEGVNRLTGNAGNNLLDGGAGADLMAGGAGNDTYVVDHAGDQLVEAAGQGNDTVRSSLSWVLAANVENLTLTGSAALNGSGNAAANVITGNAGANLLIGGGGADVFAAGGGNDTVALSDLNFAGFDGGSGVDTVRADGLGLTSLADLAGRTTNVEVLDLRGNTAEQFSLSGAQVHAPGLVGADAGNRLEIVTNVATNPAGRDVVFLSTVDFAGVTAPGTGAPVVTLANGSTGYLYASNAAGQADVAIDANARVLPLIGELQANWGLTLDPAITSISGLRTWLDANDLDGNGTAAGLGEAGLVGSNVATWVDRSGNGNNLTQALSGSQPTLLAAGGLNGLATVRFGANDVLTSTQAINGPYTVLAVASLQLVGTERLINSSTQNWSLGWEGGWQDRWYTTLGSYRPLVAAVGDTKLYTGVASTVGSFYSNGQLLGSFQNPNHLGQLQLGGSANSSIGNVGEVLVFSRALSDAERVIAEGYLRLHWGLSAMPQAQGVLPAIAYDSTWMNAQLAFGTTGDDTLRVNYGSAALRGAGYVDAVLFGGAGNDNLTGDARTDALFGGAGNDVLDGAGGADWLYGGAGNDTYVVDHTADVTVEAAGEGTDLVQASVSYTLLANVENLTLTGIASVNATGNALDNVLLGNGGHNTLDGGTGADAMSGGAGSDTYVVDSALDTVTEAAVAGNDTVRAAITYLLGANVENLVLTGAAAINGTGNALDNQLTGNAAANTLTGGAGHDVLDGGGGADTLAGGTGNDVYAVDNAGDVVTEAAAEGTDTVVSALTYGLASAANVENLALSGNAAINGTGTAGDNRLIGNAGANTLTGGAGNDTLDGGAANDTLVGGTGNDTYWVDGTADVVTEAAGEGTDTVRSLVSATLSAATTVTLGANVENLVLTDSLRLSRANGSYITLPTVTVGGDLTLQAWVNLQGNQANGARLFDTVAGSADTVSVSFNGRNVLVNTTVDGVGGTALQSTVTVATGWHQISVTLDAQGAATLYIDGVASGAGTLPIPPDALRQFGLGRSANGVEPMPNLQVADVRIWDRALGAAEVQASATLGSLTGTENGLVAYHLFNGTLASGIAGQPAATGVNGANFGEAMNGTGNALANTLTGNGGDNLLDGGTGADTMVGGAGDDTYGVDNAGDVVTEAANAGTDTVRASITTTLGANVENLVLTGTANLNGTGNAAANLLVGNTGNNLLSTVGGNDVVYGGGGADTFTGAAGNDLMVSGTPGQAGLLGEYFSNTTFSGTPVLTRYESVNFEWTNGSPNPALVNADNFSSRWSGNVVAPVAGLYTFQTYTDDTTRLVVNGVQVINQTGFARTVTSAPVFLNLGFNSIVFEQVEFSGGAAAQLYWRGPGDASFVIIPLGHLNSGAALDAVGDVFNAGAGHDAMIGSTGADTMAGGTGNDSYAVDHVGDGVTENAGEGTDTVSASLNYTLGANVENLVLAGSANLNGTGNALDNALTGNAGDNLLTGGAGADAMAGGAGNDTYGLDNAGDVVTEAVGAGIDTVNASIGYTLGANVENLLLTGSANLNGTGNALDNLITGNAGDNLLTGGGGRDNLVGGAGNDTLVFGSAAGLGQADGGAGDDTLVLPTTGLAFDLASLGGLAANLERIDLRDGLGNTQAQLDLAALHAVTDARHNLVLHLDSGDTLTLNAEAEAATPTALPGGGQRVDYTLYASTDHTAPPSATLQVVYGS